jgi:EAL domain-containing protein (putative c-di-GMP-specific phosphodiesterase class I)
VIAPATFIPLAEEAGLIALIGDWVMHTACKQNKAWQDAGLPPIVISVNVSARQFRDKDLPLKVEQALQQSGLGADYLELELTESVIMEDVEQASATMRKLRAMGVRLSVDDFGTGYSSLSALKSFPVTRLKIDRSFIGNIPDDKAGEAIVATVIALGHRLQMRVIAEGVETESQMVFLRDHMCDEIQGFYFSKPVAAGDFEALMEAQAQVAKLLQK